MNAIAQAIHFASEADVDQAITELQAGAAKWAAVDLPGRITLLKATHATIAAAAEQWASAAIAAKNVPPGSLEGEEWLGGPYASMAGFTAVAESLEKLAQGKSTLAGVKAGKAPGNRVTFRMLPANFYEYNLFHGFHADVWLEPGVSEAEARSSAGLGAKRIGENGGVGLVLGAGNVSAIGPLDALYELVAYNRVTLLKLNPTFGTLLDAYQKAFAPLIDAGLLRIVNGGAEIGSYLTHHAGINHIHITGSGITHDMIVWGSTTEKGGTPKIDKPITSELGGVSPIIVVPGEWSAADLRFQAENVATQRLQNAGHNCIAGQTLILSRDWPQRDAFLNVLREVLRELPARPAWYPGSERKLASAANSYPAAENLNGRVLIEVNQNTSQDLFSTEYFAPVLGHTSLAGSGIEFLRNAIDFANTGLDGTLGASLIVAPADRRAMGSAFDEALAELRYGTIGVNVWSAVGFLMPRLTWGAFPGNSLANVGSGIGIVHNAHLLARTERSVLWGPFRPFPRSFAGGEFALSPKPAWFVTARTAANVARALTRFTAKPGLLKLFRIFAHAFRG
jgi:acyl-CoA reductase-like NAD-dependent aldehyde dehydrogenase